MKLQKCEDKEEWNNYLTKQKYSEFLQSWEWGEFQESVGNKPIRLQLLENGEIKGQVQGFEYKISFFGKFIYIPKLQVTNCKLQVIDFLKNQGYIFARLEPVERIEGIEKYKVIGVANRQPQDIFVLDIKPDEEKLLSGMHAKTRYNIGLAERKGIKISQEKNIEVFWGLNEETANRDKFKSHNKAYYERMLELENCYQLTAYLDEEAIASNILIKFGDTLTYLHGASGNKYRNLMAPYLLQWEGIKLAKKLDCSYYDFGGIAPLDKKQNTCFHGFCWDLAHKWTGITRFKVSFGGEPRHFPKAVEIIFKPILYKLFNLAKKIL